MRTVTNEPTTDMLDGLRFLWLEITAKCNLTCAHCYADSGPTTALHGTLKTSDWTKVIDEAADLGCRQLQFIGGEPTLHPELDRMIVHARARGFTFVEIFTNATRLSAGLICCFRENGAHVAASFYSDDPEVHDRITQRPGSWRRTLDGLESVLRAGLPLRVGVIEMEEDNGHERRARAFLESIGVSSISSDRMRGVGRGGRIAMNEPTERFGELCGKCWDGKLCVTPSGMTFPCVFSRDTPMGNVMDGLAAIVQGANLRAFREELFATRAHETETSFADCNPYCNPNCNPDCTPYCNPNCNPDCMPNCYPNCNPDRR